ncbi:MAG TPA: ATP-binding protein, partial [Polyangiaceae bacterium]|nr:ATP-binding protein [Polyangiaceae bacterium]
ALAEQLRHAQKMEAVGRLAGGVAHDFNNILSVVIGYSELMLSELPEGDPLAQNILEIRRAGSRAAELTRQLLAFSRRQVLQPRVLVLNEVLTGMERMVRRLIGEDVELSVNLAPDLGRCRADTGQIHQVMLNLVVNARDAMPHGGTLCIETKNLEVSEASALRHSGLTPGAYVCLTVRDTGTGMGDETAAHIFEPFFTTKEAGKGTGLGLATVFGIVQQSGGAIWVESEEGKGTTFHVCLPRTDAVEDDDQERSSAPLSGGGETILLVEDSDQVRALVRGILARAGYHVLEAANAGEALLVCEQHEEDIDLLLTDLVMPRMGGQQLAERLREPRPEMKVLFMSGYTDETVLGQADGEVPFLQKPITPDALTRKVHEVLDSRH